MPSLVGSEMCIRDRANPSSTAQHRHPLDPPTEPRLQRSWHTHLTQSSAPFPVSLTTTVFSQRSTRWFGTSRRRAVPKGLPSSLAQHRIKKSRLHDQTPLCVRGTPGALNPGVRDIVVRLCAESSDRIPKWLLPVVREQSARGGQIQLTAAIVANW